MDLSEWRNKQKEKKETTDALTGCLTFIVALIYAVWLSFIWAWIIELIVNEIFITHNIFAFEIFNKPITYWQAFGLYFLVRILFGNLVKVNNNGKD